MGKNTKRGRVKRDWKNQNAQNLRLSALKRTDNKNTKLRDAAVQRHLYENIAAQKEKDEAIRELKQRRVVCPVCGKDIEDMASAVVDKASGKPAHFDCILDQLQKTETLGENEKIAYIGQGRFALLRYEDPRDVKSFKIIKTIEWEERDAKLPWRSELSGLYSQV